MYKNKIGPHGGNSISQDISLVSKKCFSEAIERRALMFPTINCNQKYLAFDIITKTKTYILGKTFFLVNDFFFPYYVVLAANKDGSNFWHCGLGFSLENLDEAKKAAYEEMRLIWFQNDIDKLNPNSPIKFDSDILVYWRWTQSQKDYIENLIIGAKHESFCEFNNYQTKTVEDIGKFLASSLKNLYIIFLSDPMFSGAFSTIRCFSRELISCVPNKKLLLKLLSNSSVGFVNELDVENSVDCPII